MGNLQPEAWERLLIQMEKEGVGFYINGKRSKPHDIVKKCCVSEKSVYMPDFVMDSEGKLQEVRYDRVNKW